MVFDKKEWTRRYFQKPKNIEHRKDYMKKYNKKPEVKLKEKKRDRKEYNQRPEIKIKKRKYKQTPEYKQKAKEYEQKSVVKARRKKYNQRSEIIVKRNERHKERLLKDQKYKIIRCLRSRNRGIITDYIKTKKLNIKSSKEYGLNYEAIIQHLQPFPDDISLYHIHHIIPLHSFTFFNQDGSEIQEDFDKAFAPENHKLLIINEHRKINHLELIKREVNKNGK